MRAGGTLEIGGAASGATTSSTTTTSVESPPPSPPFPPSPPNVAVGTAFDGCCPDWSQYDCKPSLSRMHVPNVATAGLAIFLSLAPCTEILDSMCVQTTTTRRRRTSVRARSSTSLKQRARRSASPSRPASPSCSTTAPSTTARCAPSSSRPRHRQAFRPRVGRQELVAIPPTPIPTAAAWRTLCATLSRAVEPDPHASQYTCGARCAGRAAGVCVQRERRERVSMYT